MWTAGGKDALLLALELRRGNLGFLVVVVVEADVKDKDEPDVPVVFETLEAAAIDLVNQRQPPACLLDEPALSRRTKLFSVNRLKVPDGLDDESRLQGLGLRLAAGRVDELLLER